MAIVKLSEKYMEINSCDIQNIFGKRNQFQIQQHGRIDYALHYIFEGKCTVEIDSERVEIGAGTFILFRPNEKRFYFYSEHVRTTAFYINFTGTGCEELLKELGLYDKKIVKGQKSEKTEFIMDRLIRVYHRREEFWGNEAVGWLQTLLSNVARLAAGKDESINPTERESINIVLRYMLQNLSEEHPLSFYAEMSHLSVGRFSHLFKEITGRSPKQHLTHLRVEKAQIMLIHTSKTLSEIANAVGIPDPNYFTRIIKKHTGKTPGEYRKKKKQ